MTPTENRLIPYPSMKNKMEEVYYVAPGLFNHIIRTIMTFLHVSDISNFMQACKPLADVGKSTLTWHLLFHRDYCYNEHDEGIDCHTLYKQFYMVQFNNGIGVKLSCSRQSLSLGMRTVITTTIYNNTDYPLIANQQDAPSRRYESAGNFVCAWKDDGIARLRIQQALPSVQSNLRMISRGEGHMVVRVLPPRSCTELSVVGRLADRPECLTSPHDPDGVYLSFPSHYLKVAEKSVNEFWLRSRIIFEATEILSNVVKMTIDRGTSPPKIGSTA